ncbi:MAG: GNAT family N-acetyltransferase [Myxococcota bacterium]
MTEDRPSRRVTLASGLEADIRPLLRRDLSGVLTLERALVEHGEGMVRGPEELPLSEEGWARELSSWLSPGNSEHGLYVVARLRGGGAVPVLGSGEIRRLGPRRVRHVGMLALGVHPAHRRLGLGAALMTTLLEWADARLHRVELAVQSSNRAARALYHRFGFVEEGRRADFVRRDDGTYEADIIMARLRASAGSEA